MRTTFLLLTACTAVLIPVVAQAQGAASADLPESQALPEVKRGHARLLTAPEGEASAGIPRERYAITASTDDNVLALTLAPTSQGFRGGVESALNVTVKVPLGAALGAALGGERNTTVADQGLSDKYSASLSYSLISTHFGPSDAQDTANRLLHRRCPALTRQWQDDAARMAVVNSICVDMVEPSEFTRAQLVGITQNDEQARAQVDQILAFRREKLRAPVYLLNVTGSVGKRAYDSFDPANFAERSTDRTSVAVNVAGGISFGNTGLFVGAGYQYRRDYSDPEKRIVCPAGSTTGCRSEIFDLPTPDIDHSAFALTRFVVAPIRVGGVAPMVEIKVAYDFQDKLWGVQVPVYFLTNDDGGFRGGVRFTWESRPNAPVGSTPAKPNTTFGVFMVKSFDQFGF
ncbi:hypothetical protein OF829_15605 [Sphingomonas sp. LB-2]|uniref:hypothetical protein n=1 Tax=Sphingomonas caeni TaxID=2984949 RepID=UPI00222EAF19|nr:hypothetical protein [Sphingomonas caeni]MCW3848661.1 hypothetical protein [Sphingomonas caeni]